MLSLWQVLSDFVINFLRFPLKQISMIVQVIPVKTTGPAQTKWTDSTAVAHQDLMEHNVKQVTVINNINNLSISGK